MKLKDPIIEEIHAIREAIAKEHDNDPRKIAEAANAAARKTGAKLESRPPRRVPLAKRPS
jgi:hypothetical protein